MGQAESGINAVDLGGREVEVLGGETVALAWTGDFQGYVQAKACFTRSQPHAEPRSPCLQLDSPCTCLQLSVDPSQIAVQSHTAAPRLHSV